MQVSKSLEAVTKAAKSGCFCRLLTTEKTLVTTAFYELYFSGSNCGLGGMMELSMLTNLGCGAVSD